MIWTRIRISPSYWGGLLGSVAPYMTYCFVRKCGVDCQQLPPHGNCLVNTYKELIVRTPNRCNALNRCKKQRFDRWGWNLKRHIRWRASACSPSRELYCLDGETGHRACTKNPFWYCHWHIQESRPNAEKLFPLKSCRLLLWLKCIFSHVVCVFHMVYCDDKKKKMQFWICLERHVFIATQIRLRSCYWVSQSLYSWLSILPLVKWPKT